MKHLRLFPNTQVRDSVLADIDYPVLHSTDGVGLGIRRGGVVPPTPSTSTPFYVENITQETETLTIAGYDWSESEPANYLKIPVEYSTDGTNWSSLGTTGANPLTKTLLPGDKVYLRATTNTWNKLDPSIISQCTITGVSKVGGNIMSLLYGSEFTGNETEFPSGSNMNFSGVFVDMDNGETNEVLTDASELILPATTLTESCYSRMFAGCELLTTAPTLPATTLAQNCYSGMFSACSSLTTAPVLPATTLADWCYANMFENCTSLTTAPALPATTLAEGCYGYMFFNCVLLTTAPELPATTLADSCYTNMFESCRALTTAPTLPATTLAQNCYNHMFSSCTNLNYIKCLATDISASGCTSRWVHNVATSGTFVKNPSMSGWTTGINGIPEGWTVEDEPVQIGPIPIQQ